MCALTSEKLVSQLSKHPGVAIAGIVQTANLGIERILLNLISNSSVRFLLVCGRDSPVFQQGQSILALAENGVDENRTIVGGEGYQPVLRNLTQEQVDRFRRQVQVLDSMGLEDLASLTRRIEELRSISPGPFVEAPVEAAGESFVEIKPGGRREPLVYDPKGYFVISADRVAGELVVLHYLPDNTPAHEMRGRSAGPMMLGLIREGLVSQLSHAAYLGEELAKAQAALTLGLEYKQDLPLRPATQVSAPETSPRPSAATEGTAQTMSSITPPMTSEEFVSVLEGGKVDVAIRVSEIDLPTRFRGTLLKADEAKPFEIYHKTASEVVVGWGPATKVVMGVAGDVVKDAIVRVRGTKAKPGEVEGEVLVILTKAARVED